MSRLTQLAEHAIAAAEALNACRNASREWHDLSDVEFEARADFLDALTKAGVSRALLGRLQETGVI